MRVLIAVPFGDQRGGAEKMLLHLLRANRLGPRVEYGVAFLTEGPLVDEVTSLGYQVWQVHAGRMREVHRLTAAIRVLRSILGTWRADTAMSWMAKAHVYLGPAAALAGVPAAWWQHGLTGGGWLDRAATAIPAALIFCPCQASVDAQRTLQPRRPASVVFPAVDMDMLRSERAVVPAAARKGLGLSGDGPLVGIVARLQRSKGIDVFLNAAVEIKRGCPETRFVVVGGEHFSEPDLPGQLRAQAEQQGLADYVSFAGHQTNPERWMRAMDVVVHASIGGEAFATVVAEAMALGRPTVASAVGGPVEYLTDGVDGLLVPPADAPALAAAVLRLLRDEDLRGRVSAAAPAVAARFGAPRLALEVAAHLEAMARSRRPVA